MMVAVDPVVPLQLLMEAVLPLSAAAFGVPRPAHSRVGIMAVGLLLRLPLLQVLHHQPNRRWSVPCGRH